MQLRGCALLVFAEGFNRLSRLLNKVVGTSYLRNHDINSGLSSGVLTKRDRNTRRLKALASRCPAIIGR